MLITYNKQKKYDKNDKNCPTCSHFRLTWAAPDYTIEITLALRQCLTICRISVLICPQIISIHRQQFPSFFHAERKLYSRFFECWYRHWTLSFSSHFLVKKWKSHFDQIEIDRSEREERTQKLTFFYMALLPSPSSKPNFSVQRRAFIFCIYKKNDYII